MPKIIFQKLLNVKFVQPYCLPIKEEVSFSHLAYAFLNNGFVIEKDILNLYPRAWPERLEIFEKAAQYCEMENALNSSENSNKRKIKI